MTLTYSAALRIPTISRPGEVHAGVTMELVRFADGRPVTYRGNALFIPVFSVLIGAQHPLVTAPTLGNLGRWVRLWSSLS